MLNNYLKRTAAGILSAAVVASAIPFSTYAPFLETVSLSASAAVTATYYDYNYSTKNFDSVTMECSVIDSETELATNENGQLILSGGWYVVVGEVTWEPRVIVNNDVRLILSDNCKLTVNQGIQVEGEDTLMISATSFGDEMGELIANVDIDLYEAAAIGSDRQVDSGKITINGGKISAYGGGNSAAIGGGVGGKCNTITINGGIIWAEGQSFGPGIGSGAHSSGGEIVINGGEITAYGNQYAGGIGGGHMGKNVTITINGGKIEAMAGEKCPLGISDGNTPYYDSQTIIVGDGVELREYRKGYTITKTDAQQWNDVFKSLGKLVSVEAHGHAFSDVYECNGKSHWHPCTAQGCDLTDYFGVEQSGYGDHIDENEDGLCDVCLFDMQLEREKEQSIALLKEAAKDYPSDKADTILENAIAAINAANTIEEVTAITDQASVDFVSELLDAFVANLVPADAPASLNEYADSMVLQMKSSHTIDDLLELLNETVSETHKRYAQAYDDNKENAQTVINNAADGDQSDAMAQILEEFNDDLDECETISEVNKAVSAAKTKISRLHAVVPEFVGMNAAVGGDICLEFCLTIPQSYADGLNGSVVISMNGAEDKNFTDFGTPDENGDYHFAYNINAIQMGETITAAYVDKDGETVSEQSITFEEYTAKLLNETSILGQRIFLDAILNYGNAAQQALSAVNGWELGKDYAAMTRVYQKPADHSEELKAYQANVQRNTEDADVTRMQFSVLFDSKAELNLYLTADAEPTVSVGSVIDGEKCEGTDNVWKYVISDYRAFKLGDAKTVDINSKSICIENFSPMSYAYAMLSDADEKTADLANAFYEFYIAAQALL